MMKPFGVISDTHNHDWSAFSTVDADGVNSRLREILNETYRCAKQVKELGGDTIYHCGDLFHVRGKVAPSVLNPTKDVYKKIIDMGVKIYILAGNHDLEGKESIRVSNAITALEDIGCVAVHEPTLIVAGSAVMIPWQQNIDLLKRHIEDMGPAYKGLNLFLHAPVDGVIPGLPDHGLTAEYISSVWDGNVFVGHYHHHKRFEGTNVYSVGALTHQTWGDVNSKAGFLIVDGKDVQWQSTRAPKFVEITGEISEADAMDLCDGNYARVRMTTGKTAEIDAMRGYLEGFGAKGVVILAEPPKTVASRTTSAVKAGASMEVSIGDWITKSPIDNKEAVCLSALEVLNKARALTV